MVKTLENTRQCSKPICSLSQFFDSQNTYYYAKTPVKIRVKNSWPFFDWPLQMRKYEAVFWDWELMENSKNDKLMRFGLFIPLMPMILTVILIIVRGVPWPMLRMSLVSVGVSLGWRRVKFPSRKLGAVQWLSSKKEWNFWDNLNTFTVTCDK